MRQAEIEIGKEYAYRWGKHARPSRVQVLEKSLRYGRAEGRGVSVRFLTRDRVMTVNALGIVCLWSEWEEGEQVREERRAAKRQRQRDAKGAASRLEMVLANAGIETRSVWSDESIRVHLGTGEAVQLAQVLEGLARE